ncbi:MAG: A24 family peptidase C-terminal domain-containing protein [Candidatus Bathyarchaeia archaeon]
MLLDGLRVLITLIVFSLGAWSDIRTREVSNYLWLFYYPVGVLLGTLGIFLADGDWIYYLFSVVMSAAFAIIFFYVGFFGGADAKALIGLSLILPYLPPSITFFRGVLPGYPLPVTVLFNSSLVSIVVAVPYMTVRNVLWKVRTKESLFEGFEGEHFTKKLLAFVTGYKVSASELSKGFFYPMEKTGEAQDKAQKRFRFLVRVLKEPTRSEIASGEYVWASPGIPMMVSILFGFLIAVLYGDLLYALISFSARCLS